MILEDAPSIKAALATMHPVARDATQTLAGVIMNNPDIINDTEALQRKALECCILAYSENGNDLEDPTEAERFKLFLESNGANVLDLAVSIILCIIKGNQRRRKWGAIGKVAAAAGLVAVGAFFG